MKNFPLTWAAILVPLIIQESEGQVLSFGTCPDSSFTDAVTFGITTLANTWREEARTKSWERHGWTCVTYTISEVTSLSSYSARIAGIHEKTGKRLSEVATITVGGNSVTNIDATTFFTLKTQIGPIPRYRKFYVIGYDTTAVNDPKRFIILYSCENVTIWRKETVLLLTHSTITDAERLAAFTFLSNIGFSRISLVYNYGSGC